MFAERVTPAASRAPNLPRSRRALGAVVLGCVLLTAAGCSHLPLAPVAGPDPSDPFSAAPPVAYRSAVAPYEARRPVEPSSWGGQEEKPAAPTER